MGVTMFGSKHDQVGVLVEPNPPNQIDITDAQQVAHFINLIWRVSHFSYCCPPADSHFCTCQAGNIRGESARACVQQDIQGDDFSGGQEQTAPAHAEGNRNAGPCTPGIRDRD